MKLIRTVLLTSVFAAAACAKDPTAGSTKAEVKTAEPEKKAPAGAEKLTIDPTASKVAFVGAKVSAQHNGHFGDFSGSIDLVDNDPAKSKVAFEVKAASLKIDEATPEKLEGHLKSPDFFDVEKFPTATFSSTEIKSGSDVAGNNFTVTGNFQIRDQKKSITFPANIEVGKDAVKVKSEFGINRKDFNIVYPGMPDDLIKDNVLIKLDLEAKRSTGAAS